MSDEMIIPPLFRCPISLDLLQEPVTLCTGQTYEKSCIQKWLSSGNSSCPVTMQKLQDSSMVPNHTLSHLIQEWLHSNTLILTHPNNIISIPNLKQIIQSDMSPLEDKLQVLETVHSLSQDLPLKNTLLIKLDFFGLALELALRSYSQSWDDNILVEKSLLCAVKLMPFSQMEPLNMLKQECKCQAFLLLIEKGNIPIKKSSCLVVEAISLSVETKTLSQELGKSIKLVQLLLDIIQPKSEAIDAGIKALSALSLTESNRANMARCGVVEGLISYLSNAKMQRRSSLAAMAMATIENLLSVCSAREAVSSHPKGVKAMVEMVFRVSDHEGSESALNSLIIVCLDSKKEREKAIVEGVLTQLLLLLQSQCNVRTKTKARTLLQLLRDPKKGGFDDPNLVHL